jgi:hypothetical protein
MEHTYVLLDTRHDVVVKLVSWLYLDIQCTVAVRTVKGYNCHSAKYDPQWRLTRNAILEDIRRIDQVLLIFSLCFVEGLFEMWAIESSPKRLSAKVRLSRGVYYLYDCWHLTPTEGPPRSPPKSMDAVGEFGLRWWWWVIHHICSSLVREHKLAESCFSGLQNTSPERGADKLPGTPPRLWACPVSGQYFQYLIILPNSHPPQIPIHATGHKLGAVRHHSNNVLS